MFDNEKGITKIEMSRKVHCICAMGDDHYTADVYMTLENPKSIPDYIDIENAINDNVEGKTLIAEDVVAVVFDILSECEAESTTVSAEVCDAMTHMPVRVTKSNK